MKRLLFVLGLVLISALAEAQQPSWIQYYPPPSVPASGGTFTGNVLFANGTDALPSISFASDPDTGFHWESNNSFVAGVNATDIFAFNATGAIIGSNRCFGWTNSATDVLTTIDTLFCRRSANTPVINIGAATFSAATNSATVGGIFCVNTTSQATTGTVEEVLATCTLPANAMSANGKGIRVTAWGTSAANANSKTIRIRYTGIGGSSICLHTATINASGWRAQGEIIRTGAATQEFTCLATMNTSSQVISGTSTVTLANASDIVVTATTATAAGDITFKGLLVEFFN
jgi:hypothetical protein